MLIHLLSSKKLEPTIYPNSSPEIQYTGQWVPTTIRDGNWVKTNEHLASASMKFSGARAVAIHGPINYGYWNYSVEIDGKAMLPPGDGPAAFNSSTWWLIRDTILYYADDLNEGEHTIKMIHLPNKVFWSSSFTSFEVWRSPSSP